jgi:hypothetical protein
MTSVPVFARREPGFAAEQLTVVAGLPAHLAAAFGPPLQVGIHPIDAVRFSAYFLGAYAFAA